MPDNVGYTPGTGAIVAADEIGGALHQRIKVTIGADGVNDGDISSANPMPITAPSGVSISGTANVAVTNTPSVTVSGTPNVAVTNTPAVTVSGTPNVAVTNTPSVTVSGTPDVNVTNTSVPVAPASGAIFDVNAVGELIECLEAMRQYQISLNRTIGMLMPDTSGRMRVLLDAITANLTLATVSTVTAVTTVSTVSSVTNVAAIGGNTSTAELVYGAMHVGADSLRRNITIS